MIFARYFTLFQLYFDKFSNVLNKYPGAQTLPKSNGDLMVAKQLGMRTALFAGDKASLSAAAKHLKDEGTRPDLLLLDLGQLAEVVERS